MPNKNFLITRPSFDNTTSYLFHWSKPLLDFSTKNGIKFKDLREKSVTKANVKKIICGKDPKLIIFNGHGDQNMVTGHKEQPLVVAGQNEKLLRSRITYSVSCKSAKKLGPKSVQAGAEAYIGYEEDFIFPFDKTKTCKPLKDTIAKPCLDSSNELALSLLKGHTVAESCERSKKAFIKWINRLSISTAPPGTESILWALVWDLDFLIYHGEGNSKFE